MGASFSLLRHFLCYFFPKRESAPAPESGPRPDPYQESQRPASVAKANDAGVAGIAYHSQIYPQPLSNPTNNNSQMNIHDSPTTTDAPVVPQPFNPPGNVGQPRRAQLFALIIGIDDYANCPKLRGAVADAQAIKRYLEEVLQVPDDHMLTLYDNQATREAIITALKDLQDDSRIKNGDPILVFYAGHGGELPTPSGWGPQIKIQCLLPQDYKDTNVIPDRTIGALFEHIAKVKGDNITVIFDCCHSASGTRDTGDTDYVPRTVYLDVDISADLDRDIWSSRAGSISSGFAYHGLRSHVLLAACGEKELAYEHEGRGQFTSALLDTIGSCDVNDLTYTQLLQRIRLTKQNPHCEGFNRHRVLFNGKVHRRIHHSVHVDNGDTCVITAGLAHGVSHGVELTLYTHRNQSLGVVVVDDTAVIEDFKTTIALPVQSTDVGFAKLTRVGKLPLYLAPGGNLSSVLSGANAQQFQLVEAEKAKLEVSMEDDRVVFKTLDQQVKRFGLTKLPHHATLGNVAHVLASAAHFYWFLGLTKEYQGISTKDAVAVDFYTLRKEYDIFGLPNISPIEPGFCRQDPNTHDAYVIDFVVDPDALYGIKITNNTPCDLYLNAFLFNTSSLSIAECYTQSSAGRPEAPLKQHGTFTIGYGDGGAPPFSYSLEESQDIDVGHLKIFFATRPIDLSDVAQASPFLDLNSRDYEDVNVRKARLSLERLLLRPDPVYTWFTLDIPVVQRREAHAEV